MPQAVVSLTDEGTFQKFRPARTEWQIKVRIAWETWLETEADCDPLFRVTLICYTILGFAGAFRVYLSFQTS